MARVVDAELPIDAPLFGVAVLVPSRGFVAEQVDRPEATTLDALAGHRGQFVGDIEPTAMLGRVSEFQASGTSVRAFSGSNAS